MYTHPVFSLLHVGNRQKRIIHFTCKLVPVISINQPITINGSSVRVSFTRPAGGALRRQISALTCILDPPGRNEG